ncbi:hypothetical protein [Tunturiibacter gelidiferens]|uniref:hypothetical protein n=1 Tax=Tunturiibacter gelidiferens TaxID=3069689 RepID=UPI003D9B3F5D
MAEIVHCVGDDFISAVAGGLASNIRRGSLLRDIARSAIVDQYVGAISGSNYVIGTAKSQYFTDVVSRLYSVRLAAVELCAVPVELIRARIY